MVTACRLVREGSAEAVVSAGPTGAMLAASLLHVGRIRGISRPGIGVPLPAQGAPVPSDRLRRELRCPGREPAPVRDHGVAVHARRDGHRARRAWGCSRSARSRARATRSRSRPTRCWRRRRPQLRRQLRGPRRAERAVPGRGGRRVCGQRAPEGPRGRRGGAAVARCGGRPSRARGRRSAACCCGRRCGRCATAPTPTTTAAPTCSACAGVVVIAHGNSGRKGDSRTRSGSPPGEPRSASSARLAERLAAERPTSDLQAHAAINTVPQVTAPEIGDQ